MPKLTFTKPVVLAPDVYPATLLEVKTKDSEYGIGLQWMFELDGNPPIKRSGFSSMATGRKAKCRKWASAVLGQTLADGQSIDTDRLTNLRCRIVIAHKLGDEGEVYDVIENVLPAQSPGQARPLASPQVSLLHPESQTVPVDPVQASKQEDAPF
jgi:hypothetical protein